MSKKPNVSQAIRDILAEVPDAKPADIVARLAERGIKATAQYVSTIKSNTRRAEREGHGISDEYQPLMRCRQFVRDMGGPEPAQRHLRDYLNLTTN